MTTLERDPAEVSYENRFPFLTPHGFVGLMSAKTTNLWIHLSNLSGKLTTRIKKYEWKPIGEYVWERQETWDTV